MSNPLSSAELVSLFADIDERLDRGRDAANGEGVFGALVHLALEMVDGAEYAGITIGRAAGDFETVAASSPLVHSCDRIQYELRSGPCVDAVLEDAVFNAADLRVDSRWPEFGRRAAEQTGIISMLAMRFYIESDGELIAGLNLYSRQRSAFDRNSELIAQLLATHGALAVGMANAQAEARDLNRALQTNREIGMAMGILMAAHKVSRDQAFNLLRIVSQRDQRKLAEIAADVVETGALPGAFGEALR